MQKPPKTRTKKATARNREKYTAELSSGQLVMGVSVLLLFGLACFMLGVLVGKFEPADRPARLVASSGDAPRTGAEVDRSRRNESDAKGRTAVRTENPEPAGTILEARPNPATGTGTGDTSSARTPATGEGVQLTPSLPENTSGDAGEGEPRQETPRPVQLPAPPPARATEATEATRPIRPSTDEGSEVSEGQSEPTTDQQPSATENGADIEPAPLEPIEDAPPSLVPGEGRYVIRVAAFGVRKNAEDAKKRIEAKSDHRVALVESSASKFIFVHVGEFPSRQLADQARDEIREKFGYDDCFVKRVGT